MYHVNVFADDEVPYQSFIVMCEHMERMLAFQRMATTQSVLIGTAVAQGAKGAVELMNDEQRKAFGA